MRREYRYGICCISLLLAIKIPEADSYRSNLFALYSDLPDEIASGLENMDLSNLRDHTPFGKLKKRILISKILFEKFDMATEECHDLLTILSESSPRDKVNTFITKKFPDRQSRQATSSLWVPFKQVIDSILGTQKWPYDEAASAARKVEDALYLTHAGELSEAEPLLAMQIKDSLDLVHEHFQTKIRDKVNTLLHQCRFKQQRACEATFKIELDREMHALKDEARKDLFREMEETTNNAGPL